MSDHVFISYNSLEIEFTLKLAYDLEIAGVEVWLDKSQGALQIEDDWRRTLQTALNHCTGLISILSPDYVRSVYCQREMARADNLKRPIFPILLRDLSQEDWPIELERQQYLDFREWRDNQVYRQKFDELIQALQTKIPSVLKHTADNNPQPLKNDKLSNAVVSGVDFDAFALRVEDSEIQRIQSLAKEYLQDRAHPFLERFLPNDEWDRRNPRSLFQLTRNPSLLSAAMEVCKNSPDGNIPRNPGALFRELAKHLWERVQSRETYGHIPFDEMESAFARLAFAIVDEDQPFEVPTDYAEQHLGKHDLLWKGQSADFLLVDGWKVRFAHPLFLDYFAGVELDHIGLRNRLMPFEENYGSGSRVSTKWDEIIVALCGITSDADGAVREISRKDIYLAAKCVGSDIKVADTVRYEIITRGLTDPNRWLRCNAVKVLRDLRDTATIPFLIELLADYEREFSPGGDWISTEAREALEIMGIPAVPALIQALEHAKSWVRGRAAGILGTVKDERAIQALVSRLADTENYTFGMPSYVCNTAVGALIEIGGPLAASELRKVLKSTNRIVRFGAIRALGALSDQNAVSMLIECLTDTEKPDFGQWGKVERMCDYAAEALERIGTPEALEAVERWRREQGKSEL